MQKRIKKIRENMKTKEIEAFLIDAAKNCFYASGFSGTACRILLTPENNYLLTDGRYIEQAEEETTGYNLIEVKEKQLERIRELLEKEKVKELGFESNRVSYQQFTQYQDKLEDIKLKPVKNLVEEIRQIKEETELETMKEAISITDQAFVHILDFIKEGITEREIALELEMFMKENGGSENSFKFIVASGRRSALPHGVATDKKIEKGDFITMDFGTVYQGYCSDMTRTVVLGEPSLKQVEIYELVLEANRRVIAEIKAGMSCKEADQLARDLFREAGYVDKFKHSLGHGLGIEIHENPRLSYKSEQELKAGMVVTDEPGLYFPDWGGVRIEDNLLITDKGCQVLTKSAKDLIIL